MALTASLKEAQAQAETLRGELKTATERGDAAARQAADAAKANQKLQANCDELSAEREEEAKARSLVEADLRKTREALEAARSEVAAASALVEQTTTERAALEEAVSVANSQSEAAEAKLDAVMDLFKQSSARVKALERAQQDHERIVREMEARLKAAPPAAAAAAPAGSSAPVALLDDLIGAFQALGTATTISDVLTTLVEQLAAQYPRVALFRVKKSHLQGEHQIGFDLKTDIGKVVIPLGMDSLLARAAASGAIERLSGEELKDSNRAPFSGTPACALAIPVVVAGETLAIVYADDVGAPRQKRTRDAEMAQVRVAEAMQQHAVALLMRMTNELKVRAELQAYVRSLFHELEQMYSSDVQAGKADADLRSRLKGNLDYARTIFESRVALEGGDATAMLDDELAAMIEAQPDTAFSRDLAAVTGRPEAARTRNAAEAS
jgi:predicted  nucleic acid-binding Zn-ribbon protein